jgi:hypothetical protein
VLVVAEMKAAVVVMVVCGDEVMVTVALAVIMV